MAVHPTNADWLKVHSDKSKGCPKPDHADFNKIKSGEVRTAAAVAGLYSDRGVPGDETFLLKCEEMGVKPNKRQARKYLGKRNRWAS